MLRKIFGLMSGKIYIIIIFYKFDAKIYITLCIIIIIVNNSNVYILIKYIYLPIYYILHFLFINI